MSYNGIGLLTPRGSGTSGHVETNLASRKSFKNSDTYQKRVADAERKKKYERNMADKMARKDVSKDILDHKTRRQIEVECMELREKLEDEDLEDEEIESRVRALRESLKLNTELKAPTSADKTEADKSNECVSDKKEEKSVSYGYKARYSDDNDRIRRS